MNVPRIPDFSTALSFESPQWTTVEDDFGETGKPEQMRIWKNNDTSLTTDLLDWYHQSNKVTMIAFEHFLIQGNFLLHPWTQPKPLVKRLIDVWQYAQLRSMISNRQPAHCWSMFDNLCIDNRWSIFDNQRLMINIWQGALSWKQLIFGSKAKSLKGEGCKVYQSLSSGKGARNEACPTLRVWLLLNSSKEICSVSIVERSCFAKMDLKNEMETGFFPLMRWGWERLVCRHLIQPLGRGQLKQSSPPGFSSTREVVGLDSFEMVY